MDVRAELIQGLTAEPKYIPGWYRFDKEGILINYQSMVNNKYYYFWKSEVNAINRYMKKQFPSEKYFGSRELGSKLFTLNVEIINIVKGPITLVELGCGGCVKTRMFIDAILEKQGTLKYFPNDICTDVLEESSQALAKEYGKKLDIQPLPGDYSLCIDAVRDIPGDKLIIWLASLLNMSYRVQVQRLQHLSQNMTGTDRLLVSLDVTRDATLVEQAYLDPKGKSSANFLNGIWRLNKEYNSNIDTDKFELQAKFVKTDKPDALSRIQIRARSKCDQTYDISGLGISVTFKEGEYLCLYEGEGNSCKYTQQQIRTLAAKGNLQLDKVWTDDEKHAALCSLKKS